MRIRFGGLRADTRLDTEPNRASNYSGRKLCEHFKGVNRPLDMFDDLRGYVFKLFVLRYHCLHLSSVLVFGVSLYYPRAGGKRERLHEGICGCRSYCLRSDIVFLRDATKCKFLRCAGIFMGLCTWLAMPVFSDR